MKQKLDCIEYELKNYFYDIYNESLVMLGIEKEGDHIKYKFVFEKDNSFLNHFNICIYDYYNEVIIKLYGHHDNIELKHSFVKLFDIITNEILVNWLPELFISLTFKPIVLPTFYVRIKEIKKFNIATEANGGELVKN